METECSDCNGGNDDTRETPSSWTHSNRQSVGIQDGATTLVNQYTCSKNEHQTTGVWLLIPQVQLVSKSALFFPPNEFTVKQKLAPNNSFMRS
eukprot:scaffold333_cov133-Cylindrotheca_fusiformis.AAC.8